MPTATEASASGSGAPEPEEPLKIDVGMPNEECYFLRNGHHTELCKVGTEFCIDHTPFAYGLILQCRSLRPSRDDRITWLRDGKRISFDDNDFSVAEKGEQLHFTRRRIPGKYTCVLRNGRRYATATTILKR